MPIKIYSTDKIEIEKAVLYWIELLAEEKYDEAYQLTLHDPYYQWSPSNIKEVIHGYGLPDEDLEEKHKVTSPESAIVNSNINPYKDIDFFDDAFRKVDERHGMTIVGNIIYDLPINGAWSDLAVTFKILQKGNFLMLELNEIHML